MTNLCTICNTANKNRYPIGDCFLCNNTLEQLNGLIQSASEQLTNEQSSSFCISTRIPDEWAIKEEELWDKTIMQNESIKQVLNRKIIQELTKITQLPYDALNGETRVIFELRKGRIKLYRENVFLFGRYKKLKANISQSRWMCMRCYGRGCKECDQKGKHYISVEELIGDPLKEMAHADNYSLHASGREDVDATNTAGRPFVIEVINPKNTRIDLGKIQEQINKAQNISVTNLKRVNRSAVELVANSHFDKEYEAMIECTKELNKKDIEKIESLTGTLLDQRTPERVAHRRADIIRKRRVKHINVISYNGNKAKIRVFAEAGTYIKELINGDAGRTKPSIAQMLDCEATCTELIVTQIKDGFLDLVI